MQHSQNAQPVERGGKYANLHRTYTNTFFFSDTGIFIMGTSYAGLQNGLTSFIGLPPTHQIQHTIYLMYTRHRGSNYA